MGSGWLASPKLCKLWHKSCCSWLPVPFWCLYLVNRRLRSSSKSSQVAVSQDLLLDWLILGESHVIRMIRKLFLIIFSVLWPCHSWWIAKTSAPTNLERSQWLQLDEHKRYGPLIKHIKVEWNVGCICSSDASTCVIVVLQTLNNWLYIVCLASAREHYHNVPDKRPQTLVRQNSCSTVLH